MKNKSLTKIILVGLLAWAVGTLVMGIAFWKLEAETASSEAFIRAFYCSAGMFFIPLFEYFWNKRKAKKDA